MRRRSTNTNNEDFINPYSRSEVDYWARKWNVSFHILRAAMDVTGSSNVTHIRNFLQRLKFINE